MSRPSRGHETGRDTGPGLAGNGGGFGTFDWDLAAGAVTWSPEMYRIHGIGPGEFAGTPESYAELVHPEDVAIVEALVGSLMADGRARPLEYRIRRPDGEVRHLLATNQILRRDDGRRERIVGTVRDVTELRDSARTDGDPEQATAALERSASRFRALIENSFDVITVFDSDGTVLYTTPSCRRVLGYEPEELIGRPGWELVHPDDQEEADKAFQRALADPGVVAQVVHRIRHKDGSYRTVEIMGRNLLGHPAVRGLVSNLRDITEREEAAHALRRSAAQYRKLVDQAVFGIYRSAVDGRILSVNPALVELLGFDSGEELMSVNMASLYVDPEERKRLIRRHGDSQGPFSVETRWRRRDGESIMVRLSGRPVAPAEGLPAGFEVAVEDVSERRTLEEALRQAQKMEAVGRLAGGVAHDFNNLLTVILGEVDMALSSARPSRQLTASLERIRASGHRASALTRQLLSFSRRELVTFEVLDLNHVVSEASDMLRRLIEEDVELELDLEPALWKVRGDRTQLEQLLVNLVVNGRDAMPEGGTLRVATSNATVPAGGLRRAPELRAGDYARLVVADSGVGMAEDVRARAFEPFFSTKAEKGTGFGLATCYSVAKQHGGHIDALSAEGLGTTITLHLPRALGELTESEPERRHGVGGGSETILLVEDERAVRNVTARMLEGAGYRVLTAADSDEAMSLVGERGGAFDLLITDVVLTGMGGRELAERITARHPDIRVLFVSGYTDDSILRRGLIEHDLTLVRKPFSAEQLAARVREVLDGS